MRISNNELSAKIPDKLVFHEPLDEVDEEVSLKLGSRLEVKDGKLNAKDATEYLQGSQAISVYKDPLKAFDASLVKLSVDTNNLTQEGNRLGVKSDGLGLVYYGSGTGVGMLQSSNLVFNNTRRQLQVDYVIGKQDFVISNKSTLPTTAYVEQLYQGGDSIDICAESFGRKIVSLRHNDSLLTDVTNTLSVNIAALVNNNSIRVNTEGKLTSGLIFQQMNNLGVRNGNETYAVSGTGCMKIVAMRESHCFQWNHTNR
ncbi:hypothetical protein DFS34DRAFT_366859 [Phlyctochytrium arcticum]|nr:hypothetical protein DFS34DRAFT_366859 [Phlyctochytrium arcticum]